MKKQDLTEYSDNELSLVVFNDEYLYKLRRSKRSLLSEIEESFEYTPKQLEVLLNDIDEDLKN